jgi:hypothetical protein
MKPSRARLKFLFGKKLKEPVVRQKGRGHTHQLPAVSTGVLLPTLINEQGVGGLSVVGLQDAREATHGGYNVVFQLDRGPSRNDVQC